MPERRMRILTPDGVKDVDVPNDNDASMLGRYWNDVKHYLNTGDESGLSEYEGVSIAGQPLLADPDAIDEEGRRGDLGFEDIYE